MEDTVFFHKSCKGRVIINASGLFNLLSPSFGVSPSGLSLGVSELSFKKEGKHSFFCANCQEEFPPEDAAENIEVRCLCCRQVKSASVMYTCPQIPYICSSCKDYLTGEAQNPPAEVARIISYLDIRRSPIKMTKLSDMLKKKVQF